TPKMNYKNVVANALSRVGFAMNITCGFSVTQGYEDRIGVHPFTTQGVAQVILDNVLALSTSESNFGITHHIIPSPDLATWEDYHGDVRPGDIATFWLERGITLS
ncbi:hypothetical protein ACJX0J_019535, partial [Zea mays]